MAIKEFSHREGVNEGGETEAELARKQYQLERNVLYGKARPIERRYGGVEHPSQTDRYAERISKDNTNESPNLSPQLRTEMLENRAIEKRETAYTALIKEFETRIMAGQSPADILINFSNFYAKSQNSEVGLRESEKRWVKYNTVTDAEVSAVAGNPITRPVFTIIDPAVYKQFERIFRHGSAGASHGLFIVDARTPGKKDTGTGIVVARANSENIIQHEIFHSADRNNDKRGEGFDLVVSEMFAYFQEYIVKNNEDWPGYENQLVNKVYYDAYAKAAEKAMTYGDYVVAVRRAIKKIQGRFLKTGAISTQRSLERAQTLNEVLLWETAK